MDDREIAAAREGAAAPDAASGDLPALPPPPPLGAKMPEGGDEIDELPEPFEPPPPPPSGALWAQPSRVPTEDQDHAGLEPASSRSGLAPAEGPQVVVDDPVVVHDEESGLAPAQAERFGVELAAPEADAPEPAAGQVPIAARARVGRAYAPMVSPPTDLPARMRTTATTYRAGEASTPAPSTSAPTAGPPAASPPVLPRRGGDLPVRTPGQTRIGTGSPWAAFAKSWQGPTSAASSSAAGEPAARSLAEPPLTEPPLTEPPLTEPPLTEPPLVEPAAPEPEAAIPEAELPAPAAPALPPEILAEAAAAAEPPKDLASSENVPPLAQRVPGAAVSDNPPAPVPATARARASVPGATPLTAADVVNAARRGGVASRTYRAGAVGRPQAAEPVEPPPPPTPPEPASPPEPPSPPVPPLPPDPHEPPPGPAPFPAPAPVPAPPHPVPPEPPGPQPEPGPPYPPAPPVPPPPEPPPVPQPGPAPVPPFPPAPPSMLAEMPAGMPAEMPDGVMPAWPPSALPRPSSPESPAGQLAAGRTTGAAGWRPHATPPPLLWGPAASAPPAQPASASPATPTFAGASTYSAPPEPPVRSGGTAMFPSLSGGAPTPTSGPPMTPTSGPPVTPTSGGSASYASGQYEEWARRQRPHGTVYGSGARAASQPPVSPLEYSGSLTGHLLSQGTDGPPPRSSNTRVIVIMTVVLAVLVIAGLIIAVFARNALLDILKGV